MNKRSTFMKALVTFTAMSIFATAQARGSRLPVTPNVTCPLSSHLIADSNVIHVAMPETDWVFS